MTLHTLKKNTARLGMAVMGLLISLITAETLLRIVDEPPPTVSGWRARADDGSTNQLGFRGRRISYSSNDYVVVLLGDSQVEAVYCAFDQMPERQLERYIGADLGTGASVKVFSLGAGGYGQDQQFLVLKEYLSRFRADMVILWETPANDVWNNMFPTHMPRSGIPKPTFRLVDGQLVGPTEEMGSVVRGTESRLWRYWVSTFSLSLRDERWEQYLPSPYAPMITYTGVVNESWQKRWDGGTGLMRQENLETEKTHFAINLNPFSPRMKYGLELTRRLLEEIQSLVTRHGGSFLVFNVVPAGDKASEEVHMLNKKYYRTSTLQRDENIASMNKGLPWMTIPITVVSWRVSPTDSHLNVSANDQVMRDLATQAIQRYRRP